MAGEKLDNLNITQVASLTNEQIDEVKSFIEKNETTVNDLKQLIKAEEAGKDREEVINYLKGKIKKENISDRLKSAIEDLDNLEDAINEVDHLENVEEIDEEEEIELDQSKIIELIEGTVKDLKEYVNNNFLYRRQLEEILEAEKAGKNRKTAKKFLRKEIEDKGIEEEIKESKEDLNRLRNDIENLKEHFEKVSEEYDYPLEEKRRSEESQKLANELLETTNNIISKLKENNEIKNREGLEKKVDEVIDALKNDNYSKVRDKLVEIQKMGQQQPRDGKSEQTGQKEQIQKKQKDSEESQPENDQRMGETENELQEQDKKLEKMREIVNDIKETDEKIEEQLDKQSKGKDFEEKKEIAEELNTSFTDQDIKNTSIEELRELKKEQEHREDLIKQLKERGLNEEDLREASTADLEKLMQTSETIDERQQKLEEEEEFEKSNQEIKEEAEEDIEDLRGAVSNLEDGKSLDDDFDESNKESTANKIGSIKKQIKQKFEHSGNDNNEGMSEDKVERLLESYRDLEEEEASIKVAHVMKSYLESQLRVNREMTYRELADRIPADQNQSMRELSDFFEEMHKQEYTDNIQVDNVEQIIDHCENVLSEMR